jgi:hypothetical protein
MTSTKFDHVGCAGQMLASLVDVPGCLTAVPRATTTGKTAHAAARRART